MSRVGRSWQARRTPGPAAMRSRTACSAALVGMKVAEQRPGAAAGQQAGPVRDVGLEHRADPLPVRRDEPVVALAELGRDLGQRFARPRGQLAGAFRPRVPLPHAIQAGPDRRGGRGAQPGQFGLQLGHPHLGRRDQEFRMGGQAVDYERPQPGEPQRPPAELAARPSHPGRVHRGRVAAAQQLDGAHRLAQRRDREPGRGQVGHVQLEYQQHAPHPARLGSSARGFSTWLKRSRSGAALASLAA